MDAPRGSADFEESDELQRLRRRAYGPNADIAGDASAQARLFELEAAQRQERAPVVDTAAALPAPVSERVPVPKPLQWSYPASTSIPQPVNGESAEHEPDGGSVTGQDPAGVPISDSQPIDGALSAPWWRRRRLLPWVIAAVAVLAAAIGIGVFVVDESNQPTPVAQLTPQGQPGSASIPVDDPIFVAYGLTVADFVSYGAYGPLQIWSTTKPENRRCIAVVIENHVSVFECTAPSVDTIADFNIDTNLVPPAPSGETPYIRFVLHDEVVDVYRPKEEGEFYGSTPRESQAPRQTVVTADYRFENSLADSVGAATELSGIGAHATGFIDEAVLGQTRPVLTFDRGSGLELTPASVVIGSEYTIELVFRFDRLDGFAKIVDFNNATEDCGLYSLDGRMDYWPITAGFGAAVVEAASYAHVVLTRDATDNVVAYVNGARQLSFHDTGDIAVIDANDTLRLFSDDTVTANEDSGGAVSRIRLYDGPLSASDVAALAAELPITTPTLAHVEPFLREEAAAERFSVDGNGCVR